MQFLKRRARLPRSLSTPALTRLVWVAALAVVLLGLTFGSYYYWDRYVRLADRSPLEVEIAQLEQAVRDHPQDPAPRVALAEYYLGKEQYPQALQQAEQVVGQFPQDAGALLVQGVALVRLHRTADAIPVLETLVALRASQPMASSDMTLETAYYFLGESRLKQKQPDQALPALVAALQISPTDADALWQAGLASHALLQYQEALDYYQRAVRLVPDFAEVYGAMVATYTALGQPDYVGYALGMQSYAQGDYAAALPKLEAATLSLPNYAPAFLGLGLTYEKNGQLQAALTAVDRALTLAPDDFAAQQAQGRLQTALKAQGG